ncbi:hypothetical protein CASFOL_031232 [Castilleja foliolosa]|uniref:RING-type E3 ubiquitin transferase n=1 Tax=Castilleja foliolosa TaxID=1961234 RepID=A0ABD3C5J0_9LAMI
MGSVGNQNPWAQYNNNQDCSSQAICSISCPQFCYFFFPPPPPSNDDSTPFSPLIISVIGVLASAFLLVSYYTFVTKYCTRRNHVPETIIHGTEHTQYRAGQTGLDESVIRTIDVRVYKKGDGLIEGTECAVCLNEFKENESLRLLPKCRHAFHLPCIDTWLRSQSSCPLCRAGVVVVASPVDREFRSQRVDIVVDVDDGERENEGDVEISNDDVGGVKRFGRSVSLGAGSFQRRVLVSGFVEESSGDLVRVEDGLRGVGSSGDVAMKRSVSTGGLNFTVR